MSKKEQVTRFLEHFLGADIEIMINLYHESQQSNAEEILMQKNPLAMKGFVLDMDDEFVYLGETPHAITRFCRKDLIAGGEIVKNKEDEEQGEFDEILNNFSTKGSVN